MIALYLFLSDTTNLFDVHLIFMRGKVAGCFTAREEEEEEEDVKIRLLNKRTDIG